jgi:hypothetical protein
VRASRQLRRYVKKGPGDLLVKRAGPAAFNRPDHEVNHCYLLNSPPGSH